MALHIMEMMASVFALSGKARAVNLVKSMERVIPLVVVMIFKEERCTSQKMAEFKVIALSDPIAAPITYLIRNLAITAF